MFIGAATFNIINMVFPMVIVSTANKSTVVYHKVLYFGTVIV